MASSASTGTSVVRSDLSKTRSARNPNSPNPLWAPPSSALGYRQGTELILAHRRFASNSSAPDDAPAPALATATLHCVSDVTNADLEKPATVWIAIDVECDTYYAENPASSLRSKSLGPPYTDRGYLQKLALDLAPASGCSLLRLVGSENRDVLLPGETWSVVAQVLADPPFRRKQPAKAFSLQNRPSSHALMDQLHTMLSPSGPSSQEMIHVTVSFDHALLPSNVQCSVSENLSLERVSAWSLDSRRQYLRHHRQSTRKSTRASTSDRQRRNDVACKLLDILDWNIQAQAKDIGDREALEILEDFFDGFEGASPRLQTRVKELLRTLEGRIRPVSRAPVSPVKKRRNGMELSRENLELKDITNQQQQQQWSNAAKASAMLRNARDVTTPVPAPLFSPKKRASVANIHHGSGGPSPVRIGVASERIREMRVSSSGVGGPEIGSPRFYEDEVDEANRIWKGMRDSSLGTCSSSRSALGYRAGGVVGRHDGGGEENERSIVGAPWL